MSSAKRRRISAGTLSASGLVEFYSKLIMLEMSDRSPADIYALAFSRLLKPDCPKALFPDLHPQAPEMIGTDERDLFVPIVREYLRNYSQPIRILDIGAGDGQTFKKFVDNIPNKSEISIIEPNKEYFESFSKMIAQERGRVTLASSFNRSFADSISRINPQQFDLILSLHSIYFLGPLDDLVANLYRVSRDRATCMFVYADEIEGYTGRVVSCLLSKLDLEASQRRGADLRERHRFFCGDASVEHLAGHGFQRLRSERQDSRLYGHDFGDLIALGFITDLPFVVGPPLREKIEAVLEILCSEDEHIDLCLERRGLRARMLSVREPQIVAVLERQC